MGYKELSDSYLLSMTKKQIIEQLRCAEYNFRATEETLKQQIENTKDWHPVVHAEWIEQDGYQICSNCGEEHEWVEYRASYCDCCGAKMDRSS